MTTTSTQISTSGNTLTQRRIDAAVEEVRAQHLVKAGRDLAIFGFLASCYAFVGQPELPSVALTLMKLGAPCGCVLYCMSLGIGTHWRRKAQLLMAEEPTNAAESTLDQKLAAFDPKRHGGEVMADAPVGSEFGAVGTAGDTRRRRPS